MQSSEGQAIAEAIDFSGCLSGSAEDTVVYIRRGRVFLRSEALVEIVKCLSVPWRWLRLVGVIPLPLRDWVYRKIAQSRYQVFGRSSHCLVPSQGTQARFLELNRH